MKTISSRHNALFKRVLRAIDEHKDEIAIEGPKAVEDAIANGWKPIVMIYREGEFPSPGLRPPSPRKRGEGTSESPRPAERGEGGRRPGEGLSLVITQPLFDALADTRTSQGIIALFERPRFDDIFKDKIVVALDGVQDPGNVGTIVRLAAAFDCGGVVLLPGSADAYGPKAIRASAGAILTVPVVNMTRDQLIARDWPLFAADANGKAIDPPSRRAVIIFGSEGSGVSSEIAGRATRMAIPMSNRVESLNVATSAAILLARTYAKRS
jgi:TrmH family RNA methyltransferase